MWIVRWVSGALLIIIILGFALMNMDQEQNTYVKFIQWKSSELPLFIPLYIAFAAGLLTWLFVSTINTIKLKRKIYLMQRENRKIREELNRLRNVHIEEEIEPLESEKEQDETEIEDI